MKLAGNAILARLGQDSIRAIANKKAQSLAVDYPLLYSGEENFSGHAVIFPAHEQLASSQNLQGALCLCLGDDAAMAAHEAGLAVIQIIDDISFQHLYNRVQLYFVEFERWDVAMRALVDSYAGFQSLLDSCAEMMQRSCALVDGLYRVICSSRAPGGDPQFDADLEEGAGSLMADAVDMLMASQEYQRLRVAHRAYPVPGSSNLLMRNVFAKGRVVGAVIMRHAGDAKDARYVQFLEERLAEQLEAMYARIGSFGSLTAKPDNLRAMVQRALTGELVDADLLDREFASSSGRKTMEYRLVQFDRSFTNEAPAEYGYFIHRVEQVLPGSYCVVDKGRLIALVDLGSYSSVSRHDFWHNLSLCSRDMLMKAGVSRTFHSVKQIECARFQASAALWQGNVEHPSYWSFRFEDYAFDWLLDHGCSDVEVEYIAHPVVSALATYDVEHQAVLLDTLSAFVRCRYNATEAARELSVARSTLLNRLERIGQIAPVDFDDLDERLYLGISLKLFQNM